MHSVLVRIDRASARHTAHPRHRHPPLDLWLAEAGLRAVGPVTLIDGWQAPFSVADCVAAVRRARPRLACIRAVTWCLDEAVAVAAALRRAGIVTVALGQQVAHHARQPHAGWADAYDLAVPGEFEAAVPALARALADGVPLAVLAAQWPADGRGPAARLDAPDALPAVAATPERLADYPFPFALRGVAPRRFAYLLTAWGCPRPCRHCSAIVRKSVARPLRPRSVAAVADEVARWRDAGADAIAFEDDSLFVHKARFLDLADTLVRRGLTLPWLANARPDELDFDRIAAAAAAGARLVKVGIESGSPRLVEAIGKSADGDRWVADARTALPALDAAGIGSVALLLAGLPGETAADRVLTAALALALPADYLQVQRWQPYPDVDPALLAGAATADYHYRGEAAAAAIDDVDAAIAALYRRFYLRPGFVLSHLRHGWRHYLRVGVGGRAVGRAAGSLAYLLRPLPSQPPQPGPRRA